MIKLLDLLREGKQVGVLYHHTTYYSANNIVGINKLCSSNMKSSDGVYAISFTRDSKLHGKFTSNEGGDECRFVVDGDRLSTRYVVEPFSDTGYRGREAEERIARKEKFCIPILKYVKYIDFLTTPKDEFTRKHYNNLVNLCKEKGIKVNYLLP